MSAVVYAPRMFWRSVRFYSELLAIFAVPWLLLLGVGYGVYRVWP